jgi:hypothetical protein
MPTTPRDLRAIAGELQLLSTANLTGADSEQLVVLVTLCARCERRIGDELARRHQGSRQRADKL